jgi:hypothetical protein
MLFATVARKKSSAVPSGIKELCHPMTVHLDVFQAVVQAEFPALPKFDAFRLQAKP